jgi:integrase
MRDYKRMMKTYVSSVFGSFPVAQINEQDVLRMLAPISNTKTQSARVLQGHIAKVLGWATANGFRPRTPNPGAWGGNLLAAPTKIATVVPQPALPYADVAAFMTKLREHTDGRARAHDFTILTAARTKETRLARRHEFDLKTRVWTISAKRMRKGRRPREVPLSEAAFAILKALKIDEMQPDDLVFGTTKGLPFATTAMLELAQEIQPGIAVHGFRSCFRDWVVTAPAFPARWPKRHSLTPSVIAQSKPTGAKPPWRSAANSCWRGRIT